MKLNLLFKSLTLVAVFLTGSVGWTADPPAAAPAPATAAGAPAVFQYPQQDSCDKLAEKPFESLSPGQKAIWTKKDCGGCKEAQKEYSAKLAKETEACSGFTQQRGNNGKPISCSQKYANCRDQINGVFDDATDSSGMSKVMGLAQQFAMSKIVGTNGSQVAAPTSTNCINEFDPKDVRAAAKELAREKKDLEEKIKKEKEAQIKFGKERTDKENKIAEETAKLEAESKKSILDIDKQLNEDINKVTKNGVDISIRIRKMTAQITTKSQALAKNNFAYQSALLELSDDRIAADCKMQFNQLKNAIIQAKGKIPTGSSAPISAEEKSKNQSIAAAVTGTGVQATQNATVLLNNAKKACFEKANTTKQKNMLENSQTVANINAEIDEIKKSITDEKNQIKTNETQVATLKKQTEDSKSQAAAEKLAKTTNLTKELSDFIASNEKEIELSKAQADKLTADIQALVLKTNFDAKPAMTDANNAIIAYKNAKAEAQSACCPDVNSKVPFCVQIKAAESFDVKKGEKPDSYKTGDELSGQ